MGAASSAVAYASHACAGYLEDPFKKMQFSIFLIVDILRQSSDFQNGSSK